MTSYKPYQIKSFIDWLYDKDSTPFIMAKVSYEPGVKLPMDQVHQGKIMLNLMPEMIEDLSITEDWIKFNIVIGTQQQAVCFQTSHLHSIHCLEDGWNHSFEEANEVAHSSEEITENHLVCIQGSGSTSAKRTPSEQPEFELIG